MGDEALGEMKEDPEEREQDEDGWRVGKVHGRRLWRVEKDVL